jgi:hypothetical protein
MNLEGGGQKQYFLKRNFSGKVEALHFQLNNNEKSNLANLEFNSRFFEQKTLTSALPCLLECRSAIRKVLGSIPG